MACVVIGIDAGALTGRYTGDRTYWRCLIQELARLPELKLVLYSHRPLFEYEAPEGVEVRIVPGWSRRWWSLVTLPLRARRDGVDLLHVQYTVSPLKTCLVVTTVHDVSFLLMPQLFGLKDRLLLRASVPRSIRRAERTITVSETSKRDILRTIGVAAEKVAVTPLAAPPEFRLIDSAGEIVRREFGLEQPYVLAVGNLIPRKNLAMAIGAFAKANVGSTLAIAGKGEGVEGAKCLGYVPDELLPALYTAAELFLFPSLYEGFGIPALEAMACGCPVLASDGGALPEVVEDAGWIRPANDEKAWEEAIRALLADPATRAELRAKGLERAKMFSWRETARCTADVYDEVIRWSRKNC